MSFCALLDQDQTAGSLQDDTCSELFDTEIFFCYINIEILILGVTYRLDSFIKNHFPNKPWFLLVYSTSLLKTLWEKDTLLVKSMFSTRLDNFLPFSSNLKSSSANSFSLEESKICCLGKG